MKVWIYKGDILPYQLNNAEKIVREAAMAAGDAVPATPGGPAKGVVRAGGGRRRVETPVEAPVVAPASTEAVVTAVLAETEFEEAVAAQAEMAATEVLAADLLNVADEVERQLSVEEEIERRTASDHTDTPHFRKDVE